MSRLSQVTAALLVLGVTSAAQAASDQTSAIEVKLGFYTPQIDSEPGLRDAPYQAIFDGKNILLFEAEYDYQLFHTFGTFAVGVGAGYGEIYSHGIYALNDPMGIAGTVSTADTALKVYPVKLLAVYRFDVLAKRWGFPLVPFVKLGFDTDFYQITNGTGGTAVDSAGKQGQGAVFGWEGDLGLAFLLDILDPDLANDFDLNAGVNHSYLFGEFTYADLNDFGQGGFVFSDNFFKFGLALEF